MTCKEKFEIEFPNHSIGSYCPNELNYLPEDDNYCANHTCEECWDREIPEENKAQPCKTIPNVLRKSGPVPYGEKVINEPMQVAQLKVIGDKEPEYVGSYTTHTGNIDQCANCIYRSPCGEYFNKYTEEFITLSEGEKYCNKWNKVITGNVTMCIHHDADEDETSEPWKPNKEFLEGLAELVDEIVNEDDSKTIPVHIDVPSGKMEYPTMTIKDSGARREFATGAVRDIQEGKGRCDLLPLDVVYNYCAKMADDNMFKFQHIMILHITNFVESGECRHLYRALANAIHMFKDDHYTMLLEVSKHFEEGAKKYGEYNWQKGIPTHCYIDSAVRHYLKHLRGDKDEPHDRAFVWNILCCIWTCIHKPELNDYGKKVKDNET